MQSPLTEAAGTVCIVGNASFGKIGRNKERLMKWFSHSLQNYLTYINEHTFGIKRHFCKNTLHRLIVFTVQVSIKKSKLRVLCPI